jgi:hypothetical protein
MRIIALVNSNFPMDFLVDFGLGMSSGGYRFFDWKFSERAKERFHLPITYMDLDGAEGPDHYQQKQRVHDYIYEAYYLEGDCQYFVTTELQQIKMPFKARTDGKEKIFYKLDICVIRAKDHQVFDIEIDGYEHRKSNEAIIKDRVRDELLNFRYGIYTLRLDKDEPINYKKIDEFLKKPAQPYTRTRQIGGKKIPPPKRDTIRFNQ